MMKDLGHEPFCLNHREFEPLNDFSNKSDTFENTRPRMLEEYIRNDADHSVNCSSSQTFPVVYDYVEPSPFYDGENAKYGPYINEKDLIELPNPHD